MQRKMIETKVAEVHFNIWQTQLDLDPVSEDEDENLTVAVGANCNIRPGQKVIVTSPERKDL